MQIADVFLFRDWLLVVTYSKATSGWWVGERCRVLAAGASDGELGEAVSDAVAASRTGVPPLEKGEDSAAVAECLGEVGAPPLSELGRKSWVAGVLFDEGVYRVSSQRRLRGGGLEGGFASQQFDSPTPADLGRGVRCALATSETLRRR